jgi:hypothetical protein
MSTQITTAMVNQFSSNVALLSQQKGSRLLQAVRQESLNGEFGYFDQVGVVNAVERTSRHADTPFTEVPHARRQVAMRDFELSEIIDSQDRVRTLMEPQGWYTQAFAAAIGRAMDDEVIAAYFRAANTGKTGGTSTSFLAGNQIAVGKLRQAKLLLDAAEAGVDPDEERYIACGAYELRQLLRTTEVVSADYASVKALVAGEIDTFLGFKFIRTERLPVVTPGTAFSDANPRRVMAWAKNGVLMAVGENPVTNAAPDPTKGFNIRLHMKATFGATRMEEAKCVEIRCGSTYV